MSKDEAYILSEDEGYAMAIALAQTHGLTLEQLAQRLLYDLCAGVPAEMADRLTAMLHAIIGVDETE